MDLSRQLPYYRLSCTKVYLTLCLCHALGMYISQSNILSTHVASTMVGKKSEDIGMTIHKRVVVPHVCSGCTFSVFIAVIGYQCYEYCLNSQTHKCFAQTLLYKLCHRSLLYHARDFFNTYNFWKVQYTLWAH